MKKHDIALLLIFSITWLLSHDINAQVTGRVTDANQQPIPQVNIKIQETDQGTQTNAQGEYIIDAFPGDILVFSHMGMQSEEVRVTRNSYVINVRMTEARIEIDEVEIRKKEKIGYMSQKEMLKAYPENKRLIKTAYGIINTDIASGSIRIIDGEDLSPGLPISEALLAHVHLSRYAEVWYDVDGFLFKDNLTHINSNDIDRVAILGAFETAKRYGSQTSQGIGRVIVINTKAQTLMDDMGVDRSEEHRQVLDRATRVTHLEPYRPYVPPYLKKLHKVRSEEKALAIVDGQQSSHLSNPYYCLEVYELFLSRWGNNEKPKELSKYIIENFSEDISVLKALAYIQQRYSYYLEALSLYLKILQIQSWHAQAHRDVVNAYAEIGDNEKAWMYYSQYISNLEQEPDASFDPYGEDQLIAYEMMNVLEQNNDLSSDGDTIMIGMDDYGPPTRLVFEWNNPEAEFELQFVTPEGYYDTWSKKPDQDASQNPVADNGYTSHQFFLGKENIGLWQINIDYKGNNSEMPTYLKVSVYRDYGLPSQQTEINIYKLSKNHEKVQLFTFQQSNISHQ